METVETMAKELGLIPILERAFSFHPTICISTLGTRVEWSNRLQTSAGYASGIRGITLHQSLRAALRDEWIETFLHEVAHMMQFYLYHEINHGASWWEMMHQLGQKPKRTHQIAAVKRRRELDLDDL